MTATDFDEFRGHAVTVETLTGVTATGSTYAAAVQLSPATADGVLVVEKRTLVLDASGKEVVSEATVYDPDPEHEALYAPGSKVTLPSGRVARVISVSAFIDPGIGLPSSVEAACT